MRGGTNKRDKSSTPKKALDEKKLDAIFVKEFINNLNNCPQSI